MFAPGFMRLTVTAQEVSRERIERIRAHMSARLAEAAYASGAWPETSRFGGEIEMGRGSNADG